MMLSELHCVLTLSVSKLQLILLKLPAPFMTWCCLCCRLQRPDDNTSVPGVISLPGEHTLNQKCPVVLLSGNFPSLTHRDMWSISHFGMRGSFPKKICSFIHWYANYCGLWIWNCCSASEPFIISLPCEPLLMHADTWERMTLALDTMSFSFMSHSIQPERTSQRAITKLTLSLSFSTVHLREISSRQNDRIGEKECSDFRY